VHSGDEGAALWEAERRFYDGRGARTVWLSSGAAKREASALAQAVAKAGLEGLDPTDYDLGPAVSIAQRWSSRKPSDGEANDPAKAALAELRLTYVFMRYASHLQAGRVDPRKLDAHWVGQTRKSELPDLLEAALSGSGVTATLAGLLPRHPQYALLKKALERQRKVAGDGGWPTNVPVSSKLRKGDRSPSVPILRARLQSSGDLSRPLGLANAAAFARDPKRFDGAVAAALERFERRHGQEPDGVLDHGTVAALNVPAEQRVRQIELNLERWRWLPDDLGLRHIVVNIPGFRLQAFEGDRLQLEMRVATGTREHPTPILSDQMTYLVFSPYWHIPPSIAREEWIPEVMKDPEYLRYSNLEIVKGDRVVSFDEVDWSDEDLQLRQRPGAANTLGLVKFAFPNPFNVYLHDTPEESPFHRAARDLTHGCIRVEKPVELAEWVLRGQREWTRQRIEAAMHAGVERQVQVEPQVPVHLIYQTAWGDEGGTVSFSDDLYGYDSAQVGLLDRPDRAERLRRRASGSERDATGS
jgi:murein L,D-transpeptidase YcbB/YkuD